jgi:hypothetical protein
MFLLIFHGFLAEFGTINQVKFSIQAAGVFKNRLDDFFSAYILYFGDRINGYRGVGGFIAFFGRGSQYRAIGFNQKTGNGEMLYEFLFLL